MAILNEAGAAEKARLLDLFPIAQLKETWNDVKADDKDELCEEIVKKKPVGQISAFVDGNFGMCKQHVYLFTHSQKNVKFPEEITDGEQVKAGAHGALYLAQSVTEVVLLEPFGNATIEFLWPVRIDDYGKHQIGVRFVILEKNIPSYFDQQTLTKATGVTEEQILAGIMTAMALAPLDIHKGTKYLWKHEFMDCHYTKYKKSKSSAIEIVNSTERRGIRENDPDLFKVLMNLEMRESQFVLDKPTGVKKVNIDPSIGRLAFSQYSSKVGAMEDVVKKILQNN